jgi:hypothetical protein
VALKRYWICLERAFGESTHLLAVRFESASAEAGTLETLLIRPIFDFNASVRALD